MKLRPKDPNLRLYKSGAPELVFLGLMAGAMSCIFLSLGAVNNIVWDWGWPTADGRITSSQFSWSGSGRYYVCRPELYFQYVVRGTTYTGFDSFLSSQGQSAPEIVQHNPVDKKIVVHYPPHAPGSLSAYFERQGRRLRPAEVIESFAFGFLGILFLGCAGVIIIWRRHVHEEIMVHGHDVPLHRQKGFKRPESAYPKKETFLSRLSEWLEKTD